MCWNDLPSELEEKIVSHLSLVDLKDLLSTRKVFLAAFHEQLAIEQKALCDLAIVRYGSTRIKVFADLCICLLTQGTVGEDLARRMKQVPREWHPGIRRQGSTRAHVYIKSYNKGRLDQLRTYNLTYMEGLADPRWVAFLQAVLSEGISALSHRVQVICSSPLFSDPSTLAGVKAHIAPLLPLLAGFTFMGWGQEITLKGNMHAENLGPDENKGITLQLVLVFYIVN